LNGDVARIWADETLDDKRRGGVLSEILSGQFRLRDMALRCINLSAGGGTVPTAIPPESALDN
jgi:hypothetical protein